MNLFKEYQKLINVNQKVHDFIKDYLCEVTPFARGNKKATKAIKKLLEFQKLWNDYFVEKEKSYWIEKDIQV